MFIVPDELHTAIIAEELEEITRGDDATTQQAIDSAIAEAKSYLVAQFDVNRIFTRTGSERHPLLLTLIKDIAIYRIVAICLPGQDLEDRRERYKRAIDWLKAVAEGDIVSDLDKLPVTDDTEGTGYNNRGSFGIRNKRFNYYN